MFKCKCVIKDLRAGTYTVVYEKDGKEIVHPGNTTDPGVIPGQSYEYMRVAGGLRLGQKPRDHYSWCIDKDCDCPERPGI